MKYFIRLAIFTWLVIYFFTFLLPKGKNFVGRIQRKSGQGDYLVSTQFIQQSTSFDKSRFLLLEEMKKISKDKFVLFYTPDFYDYVLFDFHLYPLKLIHTQSVVGYYPYIRGKGRQLEKKVLERDDLKNFDYFVILKSGIEEVERLTDGLKEIYRDGNSLILRL